MEKLTNRQATILDVLKKLIAKISMLKQKK